MTTEDLRNRYQQLNAELMANHRIASDFENQQSDDVIRAKKEIERIQHDIANLLESM